MVERSQYGLGVLCTAPMIVVAPEDQKVAQSGIANFYCESSGSPAPGVEWRKSGQRIGRHHMRYVIVDAGDGAAVLRIEPVRARRDNDTYECRADNGVGTAAVARARLDVYADQQSGQRLTHQLRPHVVPYDIVGTRDQCLK